MTAGKLFGTLKFLYDLDSRLALQSYLESIREALNNLVTQPANPNHQGNLANSLKNFEEAAKKLSESITPSVASMIAEMGGTDLFAQDIADKVKTSIAMNAMTPSVARDFVQELASRRATFLATVRTTMDGLQKLKVSDAPPEAGGADLAFLIPRDLFENDLADFAKELSYLSRLMNDFTEASTGQAEPVQLKDLSSSVPTVGLLAGVATIYAIAKVIDKFTEAWKRIEEIREIRDRLAKRSTKKLALEELDEEITSTMEEVVEESTSEVMLEYQGEPGRKHELQNALHQDLRRLFGQLERGLTVEFRANTSGADGDGEHGDEKTLAAVADLARKIEYPRVLGEPLLLESGKILEGEIGDFKLTKKTSHHSSSRKESHKVPKGEQRPE